MRGAPSFWWTLADICTEISRKEGLRNENHDYDSINLLGSRRLWIAKFERRWQPELNRNIQLDGYNGQS